MTYFEWIEYFHSTKQTQVSYITDSSVTPSTFWKHQPDEKETEQTSKTLHSSKHVRLLKKTEFETKQ